MKNRFKKYNGLQKFGLALIAVQVVVIISSVARGRLGFLVDFPESLPFVYIVSGVLARLIGFLPAGIIGIICFLIGKKRAKSEEGHEKVK